MEEQDFEEDQTFDTENVVEKFKSLSRAFIRQKEENTKEEEEEDCKICVKPPSPMIRQHRGDLVAYEEDYDRVASTPHAWCLIEAYGSGWSSWYLYNYNNTHLVIIIKTSSDNYECQYAPLREKFELILKP
jgi:hypothetical protein